MYENLKFVLAGFGTVYGALWLQYTAHLAKKGSYVRTPFITPTPRVAYAQRALMRLPQRQLQFVVPLQRALIGMSQQPLALTSPCAKAYLKRFENLRQQIRSAVAYGVSPATQELYGLDLPLLLAERDVEPSDWKVVQLKDLLANEVEALAADRLDMARRGQAAENARKAFLYSLSPAQLQLLTSALASAKAKGHHAVSFDERDLPK